jgi:hypothetical protein
MAASDGLDAFTGCSILRPFRVAGRLWAMGGTDR